jgi:hypothetical protein
LREIRPEKKTAPGKKRKNYSNPPPHHWFMMGNMTRMAGTALAVVLVLVFIVTPVVADTMTREEGTDHDGSDYNTLFPGSPPTYGGTAESCSAACLSDPSCNAATYLARDQSCWLKHTVPPATARAGVVSFVRVKGEAQSATTAQPVATAKSPGFEALAAVSGCLGVLALRKVH